MVVKSMFLAAPIFGWFDPILNGYKIDEDIRQ